MHFLLPFLPFVAARSLSNSNPKTKEILSKRQAAIQNGDWQTRNLNTIRAIYDLTVYPNNLPIILQGGAAVPPGLFSPNATGRVSPVGDFEGFEDSIEYFFALAPVPQATNLSTAIYDAQVVDFTSGCPEVASSLVYLRTGSVTQTGQLDRSKPTSTLSQIAFWRFSPLGSVTSYQAWIPNLQAWTRENTGINYDSMQVQQAAALGLCPVIQQRCTGPNQQFADVQDCATQLGRKPFGNFDEAWGDNIACRTIHIILTQVRPDVHCPHVGPTGGGKCVDIDYSVDYFNDDELFDAPIGSVFTCGQPLQPDNQLGAGPGAAAILQGLAAAMGMGGGAVPGQGASGVPPGSIMGGGVPGQMGAPGQLSPQAMAAMGGVAQNPASGGIPGQMAAGGIPGQTGGMPGQFSPSMAGAMPEQMAGGAFSAQPQAGGMPNAFPASVNGMVGASVGPGSGRVMIGGSAPSSYGQSAPVSPGTVQGGSCVCPSQAQAPLAQDAAISGAMSHLPASQAPPAAPANPASQINQGRPVDPSSAQGGVPADPASGDSSSLWAAAAADQKHPPAAPPAHGGAPHVGGPVNGAHPPAPHTPKPEAGTKDGPTHFKWKA